MLAVSLQILEIIKDIGGTSGQRKSEKRDYPTLGHMRLQQGTAEEWWEKNHQIFHPLMRSQKGQITFDIHGYSSTSANLPAGFL